MSTSKIEFFFQGISNSALYKIDRNKTVNRYILLKLDCHIIMTQISIIITSVSYPEFPN